MSEVAAPATPAAAPAAPAAEAPKAESFRERMERLGGPGVLDRDEGEPAESEQSDTAEPTPAPVAAKPKKPAPGTEKLTKLQELAKELGYNVEGDRVTAIERAEFREYKRKQKAGFESELQKRMGELTAKEQTHAERLKKAEALEQAAEVGDYEQLAKLLGKEDWNKLQEDVISHHADPNYKRLRQLEREAEARTKADSEAKTKAERDAEQQKRSQAWEGHRKKLMTEMPQSKHPLVAALGDNPFFVSAIMNIQGHHYRERGEELPPHLALKSSVNGAPPLEVELQGLYTSLHKHFGKAAPAAAPSTKKPAPKSAPVPPNSGVEASAPGSWGDRPKKDWAEYRNQRLREAIEKDRREGT